MIVQFVSAVENAGTGVTASVAQMLARTSGLLEFGTRVVGLIQEMLATALVPPSSCVFQE